MNYKHVYFIGIGGIGMSALARYFKFHGSVVSGSDPDESNVVRGLKGIDIKVFNKQVSENLDEDIDCFVYTIAIPDDNPELVEARRRGIPIYTYAEMLGVVSENSLTIAVSGTHGKTTTTAMIVDSLIKTGIKPNAIVGSLLSGGRSNFVPGEDNIFVVEACEYKRSFLNLHPNILVITNLEEDHLDYYKDLADIQNAFMELADKIPDDGYIICDKSDENLSEIVEKFGDRVIDYKQLESEIPELNMFGDHNISNAAAALGATMALQKTYDSIDFERVKIGLAEFKGTWRRLEYKGKLFNNIDLYDDYGHHPTEIRAVLKAFREKFPDKKLCVIFQPHLYSRTKTFLNEFAEVLATLDKIILMPIYAAREPNDTEISSDILGEKIREISGDVEVVSLDNDIEVKKEVEVLNEDWIVLTLGAGDAYLIGEGLLQ